MFSNQQCPECESFDTERVHTEWFVRYLEETRICGDCPTQWTNTYELAEKETDFVGEKA